MRLQGMTIEFARRIHRSLMLRSTLFYEVEFLHVLNIEIGLFDL